MSSSATEATEARDAFVARISSSIVGTLELFHLYLGERLGLYRALADHGPLNAAGLADAAGINQRYAREWLEEQAVAGFIEVVDGVDSESRRYRLSAAHAEVLLDADSLNFQAPSGRLMVCLGRVMPQLLEAFRTGAAVPYEAYGDDAREGTAASNRPLFLNLLGNEWLPAVPDIDHRLRSQPPARVADFGCGAGNSTLAIARAYPLAEVVGIDLDSQSIAAARRQAEAAGLTGRVTFEHRDAADPSLAGQFDLVTAFETIHDMAHPVAALRAVHGLLREGGSMIIGDENVPEEFVAPGTELDRTHYGYSALHCLAVAMGDPTSAMTGTVMRPATLRRYATEAGFSRVEILPIESDVWRFYRLYP
jgi:2-polyprenyl-3-methyl-5-hydroxy-6-metoxy-1,4-benzoquinol methylase